MFSMMAIMIPHGAVKPMAPQDCPKICVFCGRNDARWILSDETWCGFCILYETEWGKSHAEARDNLILMVEATMKRSLTDISSGVLLREEGDRIMMSIVMTSSIKFK